MATASVAERSNATGCKPVGFILRWFESNPAHQKTKIPDKGVFVYVTLICMTTRSKWLIAFMTFLSLAPVIASAAGLVPIIPQSNQGSDCNGVGGCQSICDLALLAQNILNDGIYLAVLLSAFLFAWAGWKHMSAGGDAGQIKKANEVFAAVFIGLIIILSAWLIVDTLIRTLSGNPSGMPWNQICVSGVDNGPKQ